MALDLMLSMLSHPITLLFIYICTPTLTLKYTSPSSLVRPGVLILLLMGISSMTIYSVTCNAAGPFITMAPDSILSKLSHPITLLFIYICTPTFTLMFTSPSSLIRPGVLILLLMGISLLTMPAYLDRVGRVPWAAFLAGNTILGLFQYIELSLLRKWTFENQGRSLFVDRRQQRAKGAEPPNASLRERLYFGYFVALSSRHVATPYEAKGVPSFSSSDPTYVPSRAQFLCKRAAIGLLSYLALDLAALGTRSQHAQNAVFRPPEHVPIFVRVGDVSWGELGLRVQDAMGYYVFCYCLIQCYTSIFACVVVGLNVDRVENWRPNFDSLGTSYNLRQFWGVFWHQHLRSKLSTLSDYITYRICRLRKGTLTARYYNIFLTFFISGVIHSLTIYAAGFTLRQSCGAFKYFCAQVLGIMLEDGVQAMYRSIRGLSRGFGKQQPPLWARLVGYVWVVLFLTWSTPAFTYPMSAAYKGEERDEILPFSLLSALRARG